MDDKYEDVKEKEEKCMRGGKIWSINKGRKERLESRVAPRTRGP